jgi:WD40 repeat protein
MLLICSVQALPDDQQQQQRAAPLAAAVTSLAWSRNGRHLLSGSLDKRVILWDVLSGEPVRGAVVEQKTAESQ